jgi:hypothetical protein
LVEELLEQYFNDQYFNDESLAATAILARH